MQYEDTDTEEMPTLHLPRIVPTGQPSRARQNEELLPHDNEERLVTARRIVAERCLYGVDKNPMAVEMAKLSLWLITLAKDRPFTFLDSNLLCGDSLLGVNLQQLKTLAMDEKDVRTMSFMELAMQKAITVALGKRREISMRLERTAADTEEKERKLHEAKQSMQLLKLGGDILIGIALADPKRRDNLRGDLLYKYELLIAAAEEARMHPLTEQGQRELEQNIEKLRADTDELLRGRTPFHWPLEFPEVFASGDKAGFAAVVGNPPFMGGSKITGTFGTDYREYLVENIASGKRGSADLCAYFFLHATNITRPNGQCAFLATNSVAQGDTREVGLEKIVSTGWEIPRAVQSRKWPGEANLEIAQIWLHNGKWRSSSFLEDRPVSGINTYLTPVKAMQGEPYGLLSNQDKSFKGSFILGDGFILQPEDAFALIQKDAHNRSVIDPYLSGEDLSSKYDQSPSRWVINFRDWPIEEAEAYPDCMGIIKEKVKIERAKNNRQIYREKWWQYAEKRPGLYSTIAEMNRVLTVALTSKFCAFTFISTKIVFSQSTIVIAYSNFACFALLQSFIHLIWIIANGSTHETRQRYTPTDCFETFPFPANTSSLESIGERYYAHRQSIMQDSPQPTIDSTIPTSERPTSSNCAHCTKRWTRRWRGRMGGRICGWSMAFTRRSRGYAIPSARRPDARCWIGCCCSTTNGTRRRWQPGWWMRAGSR